MWGVGRYSDGGSFILFLHYRTNEQVKEDLSDGEKLVHSALQGFLTLMVCEELVHSAL